MRRSIISTRLATVWELCGQDPWTMVWLGDLVASWPCVSAIVAVACSPLLVRNPAPGTMVLCPPSPRMMRCWGWPTPGPVMRSILTADPGSMARGSSGHTPMVTRPGAPRTSLNVPETRSTQSSSSSRPAPCPTPRPRTPPPSPCCRMTWTRPPWPSTPPSPSTGQWSGSCDWEAWCLQNIVHSGAERLQGAFRLTIWLPSNSRVWIRIAFNQIIFILTSAPGMEIFYRKLWMLKIFSDPNYFPDTTAVLTPAFLDQTADIQCWRKTLVPPTTIEPIPDFIQHRAVTNSSSNKNWEAILVFQTRWISIRELFLNRKLNIMQPNSKIFCRTSSENFS